MFLLFMGSYFKKWDSRRLLVAMIVGVLGMSLSYILIAWTATFTILISAGLLIVGALLVELTVFPVVHVLVAQASPSHRMGFGFSLLGLSESIGAVAGVMLGTYLYSRAQHAEALGDYWLTFGIVCTAVVCMGALWGLISAGSAMIKSPKLDHTTSAP